MAPTSARPPMNRPPQPRQAGIALITTLIMLSVVTLMAVTFLAVSRRERSSVTTSSDRLDARAMAEAALQRAEAEVVSRVMNTTNLFSYELLVPTNYLNPVGFVPGNTNIANVSFRYVTGLPVTGGDLLGVYRNLMIDPRVPVFVNTNAATDEYDFRYFYDFNRNGRYDTNGWQPEIGRNGVSLGFTNHHVGDPEWIGVLRRPDQPHSGSNHFVGRFTYLVLPTGKSLDLNFLHNQSKRLGTIVDGYFRNQGVGPWELNLAAFLADLNTNYWHNPNGQEYLYRTNVANSSSGVAFENALTLLRHRYRVSPADRNPIWTNLAKVNDIFGLRGRNAFETDGNDGYGDGPLQLGVDRPRSGPNPFDPVLENDVATRSWSGADHPMQFFDPQELFAVNEANVGWQVGVDYAVVDMFTNRLSRASLDVSTYDRHTAYRMLGQIGTDSVPSNRGKLHLSYDNRMDFDNRYAGQTYDPALDPQGFGPAHATNFLPWRASAFFTNAADLLIKSAHPRPGPNSPFPQVAVTNVPVWPTNYYSPAIHQALQIAANIRDATTPGLLTVATEPRLPTVYRPRFGPGGNGVVSVVGYREVQADWPQLWNAQAFRLGRLTTSAPFGDTNSATDRVIAGIPTILGARKGYPNFNEFELQTTVMATRKLELVKRSPLSVPAFTNQMYTIGISNVFGAEFWNSYRTPYPRALELRVHVDVDIVLSNQVRTIRRYTGTLGYTNTIPANQWLGGQFRVPFYTNIMFLPMSAYFSNGNLVGLLTNRVVTGNLFDTTPGFPIPAWYLAVTNRVKAALIDQSFPGGRLVDYVDLDNLNTVVDITRELFGQLNDTGQSSVVGSFWLTNRVNGMPSGVANQIQASLGMLNVSSWNSASAEPLQGQDKDKAIQRFREFMGQAGQGVPPSPTLRMQAPFSPAIKLLVNKSWQANDPLVNDTLWDLEDPTRTNLIERLPPLFAVTSERSNIGKMNQRYRPWQRSLVSSADDTDFDPSVKDPQVRSSDDWDFPTNALPTVGWLGRVHRGTPWQTIYLKSPAVTPQRWQLWTGHPTIVWPGRTLPQGTQPTNDWRIVDLFTTALNDNTARGQLSVNQEGVAAWSAVLSGVPILTNLLATNLGPWIIEPNTPELRAIVAGINDARSRRFGGKFNYLGEVLSAPSLSLGSPYLRMGPGPNGIPADPVVERIPQMVLSLLRADEARFVVLAIGQSLRPAPGSVVVEPGDYFQMPTNYVITGEFMTKTLMRLEGEAETNGVLRVRAFKESYNEVPALE